jgi:hypothetical protein
VLECICIYVQDKERNADRDVTMEGGRMLKIKEDKAD